MLKNSSWKLVQLNVISAVLVIMVLPEILIQQGDNKICIVKDVRNKFINVKYKAVVHDLFGL